MAALALPIVAACQRDGPQTSIDETVRGLFREPIGPSVAAPPPETSIAPCDAVIADRSLVIRDQATLGAADFTFARTIGAIRASSGGAATTDQAIVQSLLSSLFPASSFNNPVSGLAMSVDPRFNESNLVAGALLASEMRPIALFNRFDLMPADGSNCGEYRIIYAHYPASTFDRFLVIFEAKLPNPTPGLGQQGCLPVASFWHDLSDAALTTADRASRLASFYYSGLTGFSAVVAHANYGAPFGQVRANLFRQSPWTLREWRTGFNAGGQPVFVVDTVKQNPLAEFYNEASSSDPLFRSEQTAFRDNFTSVQMGIVGNRTVPFTLGNGCDTVNAIASAFPNRFNEFAGVSQGPEDDPSAPNHTSANFTAAVTSAIGTLPFSAAQMVARAGTQSCGGCHQFSVGRDIGLGQTWPASAGFTHVNEGSGSAPPAVVTLSDALNSCFVPLRKQILESFVCNGGPPAPDAGVAPDSGPADTGARDSGPADTGPVDTGVAPDSGPTDTGVAPDAGFGSCDEYHPCPSGQLCDFASGCSGSGTCKARPASCAYGTATVCGCDGVTYASECFASQAGTDVAKLGSCSPPPPPSDPCAGGLRAGDRATAPICMPDLRADSASGRLNPREVQAIARSSDVLSAKQALLSARTGTEARLALRRFDRAIEAAREAERAQPGAFYRYRPTH